MLKSFKSLLFILGPLPLLSLLHELMEGFGYVQGVLDEALVEFDEPHEGLNFHHIPQCWPVSDSRNFGWIHINTAFQEDEAKVFNHRLFKSALLCVEVQVVFPEDVKDP